MIRFKFAIPVIIFVSVIGVTLTFMGSILEMVIEKQLSETYGAQIDVNNVDVSYLPFKLSISSLDITDKSNSMSNIVSVGQVTASLSFLPLLEKKILIPEIQVQDVMLHTPRQTSGRIEKTAKVVAKVDNDSKSVVSKVTNKVSQSKAVKAVKKKSSEKLSNLKKNAFSFQSPDMGQAIELKSQKQAELIRDDISKTNDKWSKRLKESPVKQSSQNLQKEWLNYKSSIPKKLDSLDKINAQIQGLSKLKSKSERLVKEINKEKTEFNSDFKQLQSKVSSLTQLAEQDYKNASKTIKLDEYSFNNITELYLSEIIRQKVDPITTRFNEAYSLFRKFKGAGAPKPKKSLRHPGLMIDFPNDKMLPRVWVQQILVSASSHSEKLIKGSIQNITSHQSVVGEPTVGTFEFKNITGAGHRSTFIFSYDGFSSAQDEVAFKSTVNGVTLPKQSIINSGKEQINLRSGNLSILTEGKVVGNLIDVRSVLDANALRFSQKGLMPGSFSFNSLVYYSLQSMQSLQVKARLEGELDNWSLSLNSSLDQFDVKGLVNKKLDNKKRQLKQQLNNIVAKSKSDLTSQISKDNKALGSVMSAYQDGGNSVNKEINARLNKEKKRLNDKKEALKKKAQAKLDSEKAKAKKAAEEKLKKEAKSVLKGLKF